jgi:uncharacterized membrane protein YkoI
MQTRKIIGTAAALAALGAGAGVALAAGTGGNSPSRLDDGKDVSSQAGISEQQALQAAQARESGALGEVDLEHYQGRLVYNVDVGSHDVKVDAQSGEVVTSTQDD